MVPLRFVAVGFVALVLGSACGGSEKAGTESTSATKSGGGRALSKTPTKGVATFYDADGSGNCSFDKSPGDLDVTALALGEYEGSATCGACIAVTGPRGSVTVRVTDSCPGCGDNGVNLDLSKEAFAKIAEPKAGRIDITYQLVACAVSGNLAYHFKDGSSKYWTAIQIKNHRVPIAKVAYAKGGGFVDMERADYNYFIAADGVGDQGLTVQVTGSDGQVIEEMLAGGVQADKTVPGSKQFK